MQNILFLLKKYAKDITMFFLLIVCLGLIAYKYFEPNKESQSIDSIAMLEKKDNDEETPKEDISNNYIYIDVKGAVKKPGVYKVLNTAIINDVINMAGGFTSSAYQNNINLSKKVCSEMVIYVYRKSEINSNKDLNQSTIKEDTDKKTPTTEKTETKTEIKKEETSLLGPSINIIAPTDSCEINNYDITKCLDEKNSIITSPNQETCEQVPNQDIKEDQNMPENNTNSNTSKNLININTANVTLLTTLTGIGEAKAQAIISYREEKGSFKTINDIMNVTGIGEKMFEKIKDYITI